MGRRINKVKPRAKKSEWVFKINIELNYKDKPKIAFLSGLERSYFPEDPGYSKFGLVYQVNCLEDDVPPCTYYPPQDRLDKPISTAGYSIGGLSAPRFPKWNTHLDYPSPDKYQAELNEALLNSQRRRLRAADDYLQFPSTDPFVIRKKQAVADQRSRQCYVGFGSVTTLPRFGKVPTFNTAGVGAYNLASKRVPRHINSSFGRAPVIHQHSTEIRCVFEEMEKCIECGKELHISDHYRTRFHVRVPLPETRSLAEWGTNFPKGSKKQVNLCNVCYYRAFQGQSTNWPKNRLLWLFRKVRTCATIHEHQNLPERIHKADCRVIRRLQLKESILSKYYSDRVEESLPTDVTYEYISNVS